MKKYIMFLFLAITPLVSGCSDPYDYVGCPEEISVTVQMAEQPVFSWDPACSASRFEVQTYNPSNIIIPGYEYVGRMMWSLEARDGAPVTNPSIFPPLTYSVRPDDIDQPTPAIPLERGGRYRVLVTASIDYERSVVGRAIFIYAP